MIFTVSSTELLSRLQNISKAIPSKNAAMTILEKILFEIDNNVLTLTASDNDVTLRTELSIKTSENARISMAIPAKTLTDLLKDFSDQPITFDVDTDSLRVNLTTETSKYFFTAEDGRAYPEIVKLTEGEETKVINVRQDRLATSLASTIFGAATEDTRPVMTGINCVFEERGMICESTDAHKMVRLVNSAVTYDERGSFILPRKSAVLLKSLLGSEEIEIKVLFNKTYISFDLPGYHMICRQIEGTYPNLEMIIPRDNNKEVFIDRAALLAAVIRLERVADKQAKQISITLENNSATLFAQDMVWKTSGEEKISCTYQSEPMRIGFKAPQLIEVLREIPNETVIIKLSEPNRAGIILPEQDILPEVKMLTLLMPMLLNA